MDTPTDLAPVIPEPPTAPLPHFSWDDKLPLGIRVEDVGISGMKYKRVIIRNKKPAAKLGLICLFCIAVSLFLFWIAPSAQAGVSATDLSHMRGCCLCLAFFILLIAICFAIPALVYLFRYYVIEIDELSHSLFAIRRGNLDTAKEFSAQDSDFELNGLRFQNNGSVDDSGIYLEDRALIISFNETVSLRRGKVENIHLDPSFYITPVTPAQAKWIGKLLCHILNKPPREWNYAVPWEKFLK